MQQLGRVGQHLVAGNVPEGVVELFELIDVEHEQGRRQPATLKIVEAALQLFIERRRRFISPVSSSVRAEVTAAESCCECVRSEASLFRRRPCSSRLATSSLQTIAATAVGSLWATAVSSADIASMLALWLPTSLATADVIAVTLPINCCTVAKSGRAGCGAAGAAAVALTATGAAARRKLRAAAGGQNSDASDFKTADNIRAIAGWERRLAMFCKAVRAGFMPEKVANSGCRPPG